MMWLCDVALWQSNSRLAFFLQLFTKAWTAGLLNGLGDDLDLKRLGIFTLLASHPSVSWPDLPSQFCLCLLNAFEDMHSLHHCGLNEQQG